MATERIDKVAALNEYGLKFDKDGPWLNWSKPEWRGQPWDADDLEVGDLVRVEYTEGKQGGFFIKVVERVSDDGWPPPEADETPPEPRERAFSHEPDADTVAIREKALGKAVEFTASEETVSTAGQVVQIAAAFERFIRQGAPR